MAGNRWKLSRTRSPTCGETCWGNGSAPTETFFVFAGVSQLSLLSRRVSHRSPVIPKECENYHHGDDVRRRTRYETRGRVSAPEIPRRRASIGLILLVVIQCVLLYIYLKPIAPPRAPHHWLLPQFLVQWYTVPRVHLLFRSRRTAPAGEVAESVG